MTSLSDPNKTVEIKNCQRCKFWSQWPTQSDPRMVIGDCRRHAPQVFPTKENKFLTKFPSTRHSDFCGSFKSKQPLAS
jgi:hypothetical protein